MRHTRMTGQFEPDKNRKPQGCLVSSIVGAGIVLSAGLAAVVAYQVAPRWLVAVDPTDVPAGWSTWPVACLGVGYLSNDVAVSLDKYGRRSAFTNAQLGPFILEYDVSSSRYGRTCYARCLRHPRSSRSRTCFSREVNLWARPRYFDTLALRYSPDDDLYVVSEHDPGLNRDVFVHAFRDRSGFDLSGGLRDCTPSEPDRGPDSIGQFVAGRDHQCVVLADGVRLRCWGSGVNGKLGYGSDQNVVNPASVGDVDVGGLVLQASAGTEHTCAVRREGGVRCWGNGADGRLGYGNTDRILLPSQARDVPLGEPAKAISAGEAHTCALLLSGSVRCWGRSALGYGESRLVGDDETPAQVPVVPLPAPVDSLAVGNDLTCALLHGSGDVRCWAGHEAALTAPRIALPGPALAVAVGGRHACARVGSQLACWGENQQGQLCANSTRNDFDGSTAEKVAVTSFTQGFSLSAADQRTCVALDDGSARCCGTLPAMAIAPVEVGTQLFAPLIAAGGDLCWPASETQVRCRLPSPHTVTLF
ncbi:MAG: hypothetical protein JW751_06865 [Polyangiaceae bacterium]|nr:hypothetical protein [Polyangiaceae bacterium]